MYRIRVKDEYFEKLKENKRQKSKNIISGATKIVDGVLDFAEGSSNNKVRRTATLLRELLRLFLD